MDIMESIRSGLKELVLPVDRLYEVIVRREEHSNLEHLVYQLQEEIRDIKERLAA